MTTDTSNINFQLAADFIQYTHRSVFLTGKAGTGKTTFLRYIRQHTAKQTAVVAPTGVAAINAGGTTIHSFFQLPFTPYLPESRGFGDAGSGTDKHHLLGRIRMTGDRRKVLQQLELLVIDEISMVRADVLDAIDVVLRHFRNRHHEAFGGVQVLFIGDMYQLPPVVQQDEWELLGRYYASPFFFDSQVLQQHPPACIELDKIYRQQDETFIHLLNKVRNNQLDQPALQLLQSLYQPQFRPGKEAGYITLTTHNHKADTINVQELNGLQGTLHTFQASVEGDFNEKSYPADQTLQLKPGAQVMFIKNDVERVRRYFNGKIGTITQITDDSILVQCGNEPNTIEVKREVWRNIRYSLNQQSQQIEEEEIGSFRQFPLRLAWAITIHKSQGLTFEKAIIDAGQAFAPGQVYVALSRCTSLQGVVLLSHITQQSLFTDPHITAFAQRYQRAALSQELLADKHRYQSVLLQQLFKQEEAVMLVAKLIRLTSERAGAFNNETLTWLAAIEQQIQALQQVNEKFQLQLQGFLQQVELPEDNAALQQRIQAAATYFDGALAKLCGQLMASPAVTDSRQYALAYNEDLKALYLFLHYKQWLMQSCKQGFTVAGYHAQKQAYVAPAFNVNAYAVSTARTTTNSVHPLLYRELRALRDAICEEENKPIYLVAASSTIEEMVTYLPQTPEQLQQIKGFGPAKVKAYGDKFLEIINTYCEEHGLSSQMSDATVKPKKERKPKEPTDKPKETKPSTKEETYRLFKEGNTIEVIAQIRNLTTSTIEGHLAYYIGQGIIPIEELVSREKILLIEPALAAAEGLSITPIKEQLGDAVSYGEIRMVQAWKNNRQENKDT